MASSTALSGATEHRFFTGLAIAMLGVTVAGFARSYLLVPHLGLPAHTLPFTALVHLHAAIAFGWCLLFVLQSWLVATGRTLHHRRLGLLGAVWYSLLVLLGPFVATNAAGRYGSPPDELAFLAVSAGNIVAYTTLFGAALHWRHRPDVHKRLMALGMVAMLTAPFGRLLDLPYQLDHVVGPGLVVVALAWWDLRALGRLHRVTAWGGLAILGWELLPNTYMHTPWWLRTADWLVSTIAS
jgi:hypothetical protein